MFFRPSLYSSLMMYYIRNELGTIIDINTYTGFNFDDKIELFQWLQNIIKDFDIKFLRLEKPIRLNDDQLFHVIYKTEPIGMIFTENPGV